MMGTRGAVAWGNLNSWTGIYNNSDSYPSGLGEEVWDKIKEMGAAELVEALSQAGTWTSFLRGGLCPYCGQNAIPGSVNGHLFSFDGNIEVRKNGINSLSPWAREDFLKHSDAELWIANQKKTRGDFWDKDRWVDRTNAVTGQRLQMNLGYREETEAGLEVAKAYQATGFPDPKCLHHTHVEQTNESQLTEETADKLFIEWVYIIDLEANKLHVLSNAQMGKQREGLQKIGPGRAVGNEQPYAHWCVASISLSQESMPSVMGAYPEDEED